jgi:hypothetical protein
MPIALKIAIAVSIILGTSWLSGKRPELAGFLTALPLVSILALAFSYTYPVTHPVTSQIAFRFPGLEN